MMGKLKLWFVDKFLLQFIKGALDKLPLNGKKTLSAILLLIASYIVGYLNPEHQRTVFEVTKYLETQTVDLMQMSVGDFLAACAAILAAIGLPHKILKWFAPESSDDT